MEFCRNKAKKDGLHTECKNCVKIYAEKNKTKKSEYDKKYNENNKDKKAAQKKEYQLNNKSYLYAKRRERISRNGETTIEKISSRLRSRLYKVIKKGQKTGSAVKDLGCSLSFLKQHLESQFQSGMTWENYGKEIGKWHIDHRIPLSKFNLEDRNQLLIACNYKNLQPLWAIDNLKKSNKVV